jgi:hypothetical protein
MSTGSRFALSITKLCSALIIGLGITASPASSEQSNGGDRCNELADEAGQAAHIFGSGACYLGEPNTAHTNWQTGYCHGWHYHCN